MTETQLKVKVKAMLKRDYPDAWVYKTSDKFTAGIPDLLICYQGRLIAIELKVGKNKATKLQLHVLGQITRSGGIAGVCYSVGEVENIFRNLLTNV